MPDGEGIKVSMGITAYRKDESEETFIGRADTALYRSKEEGRDRITLTPQGKR